MRRMNSKTLLCWLLFSTWFAMLGDLILWLSFGLCWVVIGSACYAFCVGKVVACVVWFVMLVVCVYCDC